MIEKKRQRISDFLELIIVIALVFLFITLTVPTAIWKEESQMENLARQRMKTINYIENFYKQLTSKYDPNGFEAMNLVNAVRDSVTADSTFIGERKLTLDGKLFTVSISNTYDLDYDTTFGFLKSRRDTITDTTVTVLLFSPELKRVDTNYVQFRDLTRLKEDPSFRGIVKTESNERVEVVPYYDTFTPDSTMFFCPVTDQQFQITLKDNSFKVQSPITEVVKKPRYFLFSFQATNHGYIEDGSRSWD